ncbi:hypothetical protein GPECTOR_369g151 [Gonium pectorale]|uniref:Uncharacterized protein n=1 Tax=Gonium pectorale TaxID=33097 RepID=A0A150FVG7_GONPE|nr:hypothetical protein GPECTOR_369g151 [Gonium pectorale]|eukprot:KXZ41604.1 hypothetical protein GPECTOR_369g151 [Gonium pectorale]
MEGGAGDPLGPLALVGHGTAAPQPDLTDGSLILAKKPRWGPPPSWAASANRTQPDVLGIRAALDLNDTADFFSGEAPFLGQAIQLGKRQRMATDPNHFRKVVADKSDALLYDIDCKKGAADALPSGAQKESLLSSALADSQALIGIGRLQNTTNVVTGWGVPHRTALEAITNPRTGPLVEMLAQLPPEFMGVLRRPGAAAAGSGSLGPAAAAAPRPAPTPLTLPPPPPTTAAAAPAASAARLSDYEAMADMAQSRGGCYNCGGQHAWDSCPQLLSLKQAGQFEAYSNKMDDLLGVHRVMSKRTLAARRAAAQRFPAARAGGA